MKIGQGIKKWRVEKSITQVELAEKAGFSSTQEFMDFEASEIDPIAEKEKIKKICEALEIPASYLIFFSLEPEDIAEDKREIFNTLEGPITDLLLDEEE